MRNAKTFFLFSLLVVVALLATACTQSASTGEVTPEDDTQLQEILDAVANQTPAATTGDGTGGLAADGDDLDMTQTAQAVVPTPVVPTATPSPSPTPTVVAVDLVVPATYTLKEGEFPWCLARRFDVDATTLLNVNGLSGATYYAGLELTIPTSGAAFQGERALVSHPATYTVSSGDTFYSIACHYGDVWPEEIAAQNGMTLDDTLTSGTVLNIP
ncbi:LysM peptidoglycan-binding domain-containing protein [bacterium]|nr:LysM peptidoglycan-binding domain-containing protein [bacterium]